MTAGLRLSRLKFQRPMHTGGRRRPFPAAAEAFVRGEGAVAAAVPREEAAHSFAEIATACQEYVLEHAEALARGRWQKLTLPSRCCACSTGGWPGWLSSRSQIDSLPSV